MEFLQTLETMKGESEAKFQKATDTHLEEIRSFDLLIEKVRRELGLSSEEEDSSQPDFQGKSDLKEVELIDGFPKRENTMEQLIWIIDCHYDRPFKKPELKKLSERYGKKVKIDSPLGRLKEEGRLYLAVFDNWKVLSYWFKPEWTEIKEGERIIKDGFLPIHDRINSDTRIDWGVEKKK